MGYDQARARALEDIEQLPAGHGDGVVEWLSRLCRFLAEQVGGFAATITLGDPGDRSVVVAANDLASRRFGEAEFDVGEGPAHDAWILRRPVLVPELGGPQDGSWPGYAQAATQAGIRAVFAFPLQVGAVRAGVLTVFNDKPGRLNEADMSFCLMLAEVATQRLTDTAAMQPVDELDADLEAATGFRSQIYQAQGMVAVALGINLVNALARMRGHGYATGRALNEIAADIVHGRLRLSAHGDEVDNETESQSDEE